MESSGSRVEEESGREVGNLVGIIVVRIISSSAGFPSLSLRTLGNFPGFRVFVPLRSFDSRNLFKSGIKWGNLQHDFKIVWIIGAALRFFNRSRLPRKLCI